MSEPIDELWDLIRPPPPPEPTPREFLTQAIERVERLQEALAAMRPDLVTTVREQQVHALQAQDDARITAALDRRVVHLVTQRDQPPGSVRRCCERCGWATTRIQQNDDRLTIDPDLFQAIEATGLRGYWDDRIVEPVIACTQREWNSDR